MADGLSLDPAEFDPGPLATRGQVHTPSGTNIATVVGLTPAAFTPVNGPVFFGLNVAGPAAPFFMTAAQSTAVLNLFTSTLQGLVPASGGGTTNFLRADGAWAPVSAGHGIRDNGVLENQRGNINVLSTTSIIAAGADDAGNDETELTWQRAALSGAISAAQNVNTTQFSGIRDNGTLETARGFINVLTSTSIIAAIAQDAGNDEQEWTWQRAALTGAITASQDSNATLFGASAAGAGLTGGGTATLAVGAGTRITVNADDVQLAAGAAESFLGNFTVGSAVADYRAGSSVAGTGLAYSAGGTLNVGAGSGITVNANDVQISPLSAETFFGNFTAGVAVPAGTPGSTVAGAGLTYTTGGILAVGAGTGITVNANDVAVTNPLTTGVKGDINVVNAANDWQIVAQAVGNNELANMAANSIKANPTGATAISQDVAVSADSVLARVGGNLVSHPWATLAGASLDYAAGVVDYVGSTSTITLTNPIGNQGTVDISTLECGGSVVISGLTADWQIEGFTAKPGGFWFTLCGNNVSGIIGTLFNEDSTATTTDRMRLTDNRDLIAQAPQAIITYRSTRWRVVAGGGADSVQSFTTGGTSNDVALNDGTTVLRVDPGATAWTITGFTGGYHGRRLRIMSAANSGVFGTLSHLTGSAAGNQLVMPDNLDFGPMLRCAAEFVYDGTDSVWRSVATNNALGRVSRRAFSFEEDFDMGMVSGSITAASGANSNLPVAHTNWLLGGVNNTATAEPQSPVQNHPGIWRLTTGNVNANGALFHRGLAEMRFDEVLFCEAILRIPTITTVGFQFGISDAASSGSNFIGFVADTGGFGDALIRARTAEATTITDTSTGISMVANAWNVYTIRQDVSGTITFYIDDVLVATHSTNVPDAEIGGISILVATRAASARTIDIDYLSFESRDLGARTS